MVRGSGSDGGSPGKMGNEIPAKWEVLGSSGKAAAPGVAFTNAQRQVGVEVHHYYLLSALRGFTKSAQRVHSITRRAHAKLFVRLSSYSA